MYPRAEDYRRAAAALNATAREPLDVTVPDLDHDHERHVLDELISDLTGTRASPV